MSTSNRQEKKHREKETGASRHVNLQFAPEIVVRLRALIPELSTPWRQATLSDVFRASIAASIGEVEEQAAAKKGQGRVQKKNHD